MNRITQYLRLDDLLSVDDELFDGSKFDLAKGLHDNRNPHYDPTPGKWMSEAPIGYHGDDASVTAGGTAKFVCHCRRDSAAAVDGRRVQGT